MYSTIICLAVGCLFLTTTPNVASAGIADLLNEVDEAGLIPPPAHSLMTNSLKESFEDNNVGGIPCHVEYQVTKRAAGRCIKLGRGIRACASGTYLDPFHPECM